MQRKPTRQVCYAAQAELAGELCGANRVALRPIESSFIARQGERETADYLATENAANLFKTMPSNEERTGRKVGEQI